MSTKVVVKKVYNTKCLNNVIQMYLDMIIKIRETDSNVFRHDLSLFFFFSFFFLFLSFL